MNGTIALLFVGTLAVLLVSLAITFIDDIAGPRR